MQFNQFNQSNHNTGNVNNHLPLNVSPFFVPLRLLRKGAVFVTADGIRAMKTEYRTFNGGTQCDCYLLASGECAHFPNRDEELVREMLLP